MRYLADSLPIPKLYCERRFLDPKLCRRLVHEMDAGKKSAATIRDLGGAEVVYDHIRRAESVAESSDAQRVLGRKLASISADLTTYFNIQLSGMQGPQFLRYKRGGFFRPHRDRSDHPDQDPDIRLRKLTAVLFLNSQAALPADGAYCGGDLRLFQVDDDPDPTLRIDGDAGMLVAFDSGLVHEVRPITWGTRCTVAAWYVGAP
jgi:predicted 2-oxoglutarate/Fe(II)-dependent dioxygenase YbiX